MHSRGYAADAGTGLLVVRAGPDPHHSAVGLHDLDRSQPLLEHHCPNLLPHLPVPGPQTSNYTRSFFVNQQRKLMSRVRSPEQADTGN